jgi:4-hydroxy-3-methylbut-2-en-1-yl diphosphate synthase IspG/GcpE
MIHNVKNTHRIYLGQVPIGDGAPVSIQSMLSVPTSDIDACVKQLKELDAAGCDIIRVSVTSEQDAAAIAILKRHTVMPIVADIHFDYKLALAASRMAWMACGSTLATSEDAKRWKAWSERHLSVIYPSG